MLIYKLISDEKVVIFVRTGTHPGLLTIQIYSNRDLSFVYDRFLVEYKPIYYYKRSKLL